LAAEMRRLEQLFQQNALRPLQDLLAQMHTLARTPQTPDLERMQQRSDRLQKELEALKDMADAVSQARKQLNGNTAEALAQMKRDMERLQSGLSARELEELRDFLAALQKNLQREQGRQNQLFEETRQVSDAALAEQARKQGEMDKVLDDLLG